ncbi:hypothetical protein [Cohnella yongneupensis]|uniref:Uncharacterized protein n=1 Tax=Cohnella yongneupensis TaxID=425006 RepID=A0ABW0R2T8_9BACL
MQRLKFMGKLFLREPLWFKILAPAALLISIVFSSSLFSEYAYSQSVGKLATAVFFCIFGIKMRYNRRVSYVFYAFAALSLYLAWDRYDG